MSNITSALSNFMYRRNAERVDTEEPDPIGEESLRSDNNRISEEDGEEGEFISSGNSRRMTHTPEALPDDEDVERTSNSNSNNNNNNSQESSGILLPSGAAAEPSTPENTTTRTVSVSRRRTVHGVSLRDLEEEREIVQRRTGACVLLSSFVLLRLWVQAVMTGDFGLLLLCLVFTSWTARFVRYTREREGELDRLINDWDENAEEEPSLNDPRLRRMSFQSQLALAIMQSQIQMMEGGYGHPDGGENRPGVGDDAKVKWDRFEFKSVASLRQRGSYGSVSEQKEAAANGGDAKHGCEEEPTCSICLCEYEKGDMLVSLPCKHVFHEACITSWTDHNTRCPLCNADLQSVPGEAEMV
eukprot:CAMPEP_0201126450 /NCGR_PEP_ID=MMETSP0850-20130426/26140_1 /ASSEMBLY_ACC=CAM_ASM_000622 /TAXON_ID=183588 /ORGANISM="Pseudo-nitzschia fraudulenta, Strain WWA7" /LENGTH=356 /DNA_ID=CAMNT_0047394889 /DNA_START=162 /DNA_END=1232 /DNA_ORIENTATION=+